jgi:methyltransferase (TIGR00027 family)
MNEPAPTNLWLASTAQWTASVRAMESARPDALIHDPWAAALAGAQGEQWLAQRTPDKVLPMVIRTRYFDDFLQRTIQQSAARQVVLLAAGLDTRAFRLTWPAGTQLFELDQAVVLSLKEQVLSGAGAQPNCVRQVIAQDLTGPWEKALLAAGFLPQQPSIWLLEGFLFYLPSAVITNLLNQVSRLAAPGSWLGFDCINHAMLTHPLTRAWIEMQAASGAPWTGTLDDPTAFLGGLGWKVALTQAGQVDAHYQRWTLPVLPTMMPNVPHNWFVTAQKVEGLAT